MTSADAAAWATLPRPVPVVGLAVSVFINRLEIIIAASVGVFTTLAAALNDHDNEIENSNAY